MQKHQASTDEWNQACGKTMQWAGLRKIKATHTLQNFQQHLQSLQQKIKLIQ